MVNKAYEATFWPTPVLTEGTLDNSRFSADRTIISAFARYPHHERLQSNRVEVLTNGNVQTKQLPEEMHNIYLVYLLVQMYLYKTVTLSFIFSYMYINITLQQYLIFLPLFHINPPTLHYPPTPPSPLQSQIYRLLKDISSLPSHTLKSEHSWNNPSLWTSGVPTVNA